MAKVNYNPQPIGINHRVGKSGYRGVRRRSSGRWQAYCRWWDGMHHIGMFDTAEQAADAFDRFVAEHGLGRATNFDLGLLGRKRKSHTTK
jgi:hypothetical protein